MKSPLPCNHTASKRERERAQSAVFTDHADTEYIYAELWFSAGRTKKLLRARAL